MKRIIMIFAAMAAVLSSCTKNEMDPVTGNEDKDIVLNISVSDPGADTKALIKTGWTLNDEISIWYDTNTGATPDLVITYNGTKWIEKEDATVSENKPQEGEGKYAKAIYNGTVKVASKDDYTFENNELTFNIKNWKFLTEVQVVVKGLTGGSADKYTLACDKFTPLASTGNGYTVGSDAITASAGTMSAAVTGIYNADGVAFVFVTADYSATAAEYKFVLKDNTSGSAVTKVYKPNVAIAAKEGKSSIKALAIVSTSFVDPVIPEFVDLDLTSGLKWRSWNLGATKPEEYGTYFQWGEIAGHECNGTTNGSTYKDSYNFNWASAPFNNGQSGYDGTYFTENKGTWLNSDDVLKSDYDAAYQADPKTSKSWKMPTKDDFKELAKNCFAEWTDSYNGTGVKGVIFWKPKTGDAGWYKPATTNKGRKIKDDGSYDSAVDHTFSNKYDIYMDSYVFFPAAGSGDGTSLIYAGDRGYYWSGTLTSSYPNLAYTLSFDSGNVYPQSSYYRCLGRSVRPVSD